LCVRRRRANDAPAAPGATRAGAGSNDNAWHPPGIPRSLRMIHCVLHDPGDSVAVIVVEGVKAGAELTGLILDEDRTITLPCVQDIPIGHKVALKDMAVGDTVIKYGIDIGKVVAPIARGQHAHVHNIKTKRW
jgi:(2R)-sulfolactate sulfo-lyase subunit alpha